MEVGIKEKRKTLESQDTHERRRRKRHIKTKRGIKREHPQKDRHT